MSHRRKRRCRVVLSRSARGVRMSLMGLGSAAILAAVTVPVYASTSVPALHVSTAAGKSAAVGGTDVTVSVVAYTSGGTVHNVRLLFDASTSSGTAVPVSRACADAVEISGGCRFTTLSATHRMVTASFTVPSSMKSGTVHFSATAKAASDAAATTAA